MKKIVYFSHPTYSHLDWGGTLNTLKVMKEEGYGVKIASGNNIRDYVRNCGFDFFDIGLEKIQPLQQGQSITELLSLHLERNFFNLEDTIKAVDKSLWLYRNEGFDIIVADPFCKVAPILSSLLKKPYVSITPIRKSIKAEIRDNILKKANYFEKKIRENFGNIDLGLDSEYPLMQVSPKLNIYFSILEFYNNERYKNMEFVGADKLRSEDLEKKYGSVNIFYSSGTLFWSNKQIQLILGLAERYREFNFFITRGGGLFSLDYLPENVTLFDFCDEEELFPKMDLIISQGGIGTTTKAIRAGKPLLVLPLFYANYNIAEKVNKYQNGVSLISEEEQISKINSTLECLVEKKIYKKKALQLQEKFHVSGGYKKASKLLSNLLEEIK